MDFPHLIIGVTGNAMEDELAEFLQGGADLVLTKPMRANMLDMVLTFMIKEGTTSQCSQDQRIVVIDREMSWQSFYHNSISTHEEMSLSSQVELQFPQAHQPVVKC
jgi:DNA-binding response OmpR family regulator